MSLSTKGESRLPMIDVSEGEPTILAAVSDRFIPDDLGRHACNPTQVSNCSKLPRYVWSTNSFSSAAMTFDDVLHPAYFETRFRQHFSETEWPPEFAIITAYATTGESWTDERNAVADRSLESELQNAGRWFKRLTGHSPTTGHAEPGWAVELSLDAACEIGCRFKQDAIYFVKGDSLFVSLCEHARRRLVSVGAFRVRLSGPEDHLDPAGT